MFIKTLCQKGLFASIIPTDQNYYAIRANTLITLSTTYKTLRGNARENKIIDKFKMLGSFYYQIKKLPEPTANKSKRSLYVFDEIM